MFGAIEGAKKPVTIEVTRETVIAAIQEFERSLRQTVTVTLATCHGPDWATHLSGRIRQELARLETQEQNLRPKAKVDENPLAYAGLAELRAICQHHWTCCSTGIGLWTKQDDMVRDMDHLMTIRGPAAHSRELQPYELLEAQGIALRLSRRTHRVATPLAKPGRVWPFITWAEDSLGNRSSEGPMPSLNAKQPLRMGDRIELRVHAEDSQSRPLQYRLLDYDASVQLPWQGAPIFVWSPTRACRSAEFSIEVRSLDGPWASRECDDFVEFRYEVHP